MKLPRVKAQILWGCSFYDGATTGIALYNSKHYWFTRRPDPAWEVTQDNKSKSRPERGNSAYFLYELTEEEIQEEIQKHKIYQLLLGYNSDYKDGIRHKNTKKYWWHKFFQNQRWRIYCYLSKGYYFKRGRYNTNKNPIGYFL